MEPAMNLVYSLKYLRYRSNMVDNNSSSQLKKFQFLIFDAAHKGYIIEDDCMEILYARYGG